MVNAELFFFSLMQIEAFPFKCLSSQSNVRCTAVTPIVPNISCVDKYDGESALAHPYFGKPLNKPSTRASAANHNGQMASLLQLPHYVHSKITNIHEKCTQTLFLHNCTITRTGHYFLLTDLSIINECRCHYNFTIIGPDNGFHGSTQARPARLIWHTTANDLGRLCG